MKLEKVDSEAILEDRRKPIERPDKHTVVVQIGGFKFLMRYVPKSKTPGDQGIMLLGDVLQPTPEMFDAMLTAYEGYPNFVRFAEVAEMVNELVSDISKRKEVSVKYIQMVLGLIKEVEHQPFWYMTPESRIPIVDSLQKTIKQIEDGEYEVKSYRLSKAKPKSPYKRLRSKHQGYVYLMRTSFGYWKIGFTKNPKQRLSAMVKLPFSFEYEYLIPTKDMKGLEWTLHETFKDCRAKGTEFFELTDEQVEWIKHEYKGYKPE